MVKLFVGGFPLDSSELQLVELVSRYATVSTIKIVRDKKTRKCKGYAFLEVTDLEGAQNAIIELDGTMFGNRALTLNITEDKPAAPAYPARKPFSKPGGSYNKVERPSSTGYSSPSSRPPSSGGSSYSPPASSSAAPSYSSPASASESDFKKKRPRKQL